MRKILILLFSLLAFYACDPITERLILINNTEDTFYYLLDTDTVPHVNRQLRLLYPNDTVKPDFYVTGFRNYEGWEYKINQKGTDSALHIFIFRPDQITDEMIEDAKRKREHVIYIGEKLKDGEAVNLTEELIKNREYERLSFKVKELDSLNWTVVYSEKK